MARYNIVGHYYRPAANSDKIYIFGIRKTGSEFAVIAKWGRRGNNLSNQVKGNFPNETQAFACMDNLWKARFKEGYMDIETAEYRNHMQGHSQTPLTLNSVEVSKNLEADPGIQNSTTAPATTFTAAPVSKKTTTPPPPPKKEEETDETMICVDNSGMEDRFDVGIEYVVEPIIQGGKVSKDMIAVYDKLGRKDEYFMTRFTKVGSYTTTSDKLDPKKFFGMVRQMSNSINLGPVFDGLGGPELSNIISQAMRN